MPTGEEGGGGSVKSTKTEVVACKIMFTITTNIGGFKHEDLERINPNLFGLLIRNKIILNTTCGNYDYVLIFVGLHIVYIHLTYPVSTLVEFSGFCCTRDDHSPFVYC